MMPKRHRHAKAREDDDYYLPSSPSLSSLPDEIVLNCLARVPRTYDLNLSYVSKTLRSLIHSSGLLRLRSLRPKKSVYLSIGDGFNSDNKTYYWFTLETKKTKKKVEYRLVKVPFPSHPFMYRSSTVVVGSEIYFIGGYLKPLRELWILDTKSGEFTQGPSMKVARTSQSGVGEIDGKIYVIGGCEEEIQVEVFDTKTRSWKVGESPEERLQERLMIQQSASLNGKVYVVETGSMAVYDPSEGGRRMEKVRTPSDTVFFMCVVGDVLYAYFGLRGLMWFDVKGKAWREVVDGGCLKGLNVNLINAVTAEYNGKLVILWHEERGHFNPEDEMPILCALIVLDRVGERIRGTVEWNGTVGILPGYFTFCNCLVVSD